MNKRNPEKLEICLTKFKNSWSDFDKLYQILNNWNNIIGNDLAKECKPIKFENKILTIVANHPQWRHALIYNKHKLKESINSSGINVKNIRIIQNYESQSFKRKFSNTNEIWDNHPSRVKNKKLLNCTFCNRPTPIGEIERWGKCTFCWREKNKI